MSNDFVAEANAKSAAALWVAYCDKKMELEDAQDRIEKLEKALRVAAGYISTFPPHTDQHPQDVYDWILKEADYENGD